MMKNYEMFFSATNGLHNHRGFDEQKTWITHINDTLTQMSEAMSELKDRLERRK